MCFIASLSSIHEPISYEMVKNNPNWIRAISLELDALEANKN